MFVFRVPNFLIMITPPPPPIEVVVNENSWIDMGIRTIVDAEENHSFEIATMDSSCDAHHCGTHNCTAHICLEHSCKEFACEEFADTEEEVEPPENPNPDEEP
jgi:hypothetical protein